MQKQDPTLSPAETKGLFGCLGIFAVVIGLSALAVAGTCVYVLIFPEEKCLLTPELADEAAWELSTIFGGLDLTYDVFNLKAMAEIGDCFDSEGEHWSFEVALLKYGWASAGEQEETSFLGSDYTIPLYRAPLYPPDPALRD